MLMEVHPDTKVSEEVGVPDVCTMPREILVEWVKQLRSGNYRQGRGFLCHLDHYCCLGVLQAIMDVPNGTNADGSPNEILDARCGLSRNLQSHLAQANDGTHGRYGNGLEFPPISADQEIASFNRIADWIEGYLLS